MPLILDPPATLDLAKLVELCHAVINSADDTGCTDDLTVISADALENLHAYIEGREPRTSDDESDNVWQCGACGYESDEEFDRCPDCGVPDQCYEVAG